MNDETAPPPQSNHQPSDEDSSVSLPRALRAGMCLKSISTGQCYKVGQNLAIFTSDYPHIHPNFILARDIRNLMREGELYIDECASAQKQPEHSSPENSDSEKSNSGNHDTHNKDT